VKQDEKTSRQYQQYYLPKNSESSLPNFAHKINA